MPDGQVFNQEVYDIMSKAILKKNYKTVVMDSIVTDSKTTRIVSIVALGETQVKNEFQKTSKSELPEFEYLIGAEFPIENFKDTNGKNFPKDYFKGKPTLLNFWFTSCAPCIIELPHLDELKQKFGSKVNFVGITFDKADKVNKFLQKYTFDYFHITDSKTALQNLKISRYPMTIILDKNGKIERIYGGVTDFELEEIDKFLKT